MCEGTRRVSVNIRICLDVVMMPSLTCCCRFWKNLLAVLDIGPHVVSRAGVHLAGCLRHRDTGQFFSGHLKSNKPIVESHMNGPSHP